MGWTKGPWRSIRDNDHPGNRRVISFHPAAVAKVYADEPRPDDEKAIANAALIAASPDLYSALAAMIAAHDGSKSSAKIKHAAFLKAQASLSAARGEK